MISLSSFRGIVSILLILAGLWVLFLIAAHLILDIEQGKRYIESSSLAQVGNTRKEIIDDKLYFEKTEDTLEQVDCEIPHDKSYPDCKNRVELLRKNWQTNSCYKEYDVDGTICSLVIYLSEVESWCPQFPWRKYMKKKERRLEKAVMEDKPDHLLSMLISLPGFQPIRSRILDMWPYWKDGLRFMQKTKGNIDTRNKKKILVFIGELMDATANMSHLTDDLLQWSDLLASLCVLGHDVTIKADRVELLSLMTEGSQFTHRGCDKGDSGFDLIYIDITGLQQLVMLAPDPEARSLIWAKYSCRLRVVIPFGMDAQFNYRDYKEQVMGTRSQQGNWNLNLKQFLSKYPLSVDNSFLGFALKSSQKETTPEKTSMAFVHGKPSEFKVHKNFLKAIYTQMRIHTALSTDVLKKDLPFIVNHENLNLTGIRRLLRKSKLFIGLGLPYEDHLALDAIAQGSVFINPKFPLHKNRLNDPTLQDLPSSRNLSSQHPYAETFIGEPYVYTVNIWNKTEVKISIKNILSKPVKPFVPFEFSCEGMLERLNAYIDNQDFCDKSYHWPLQKGDLQIIIARPGKSCTDTCFNQDLTCESEYFYLLNSSNITGCEKVISEESTVAPAMEEVTSKCVFQKQPLLFSCSAHHASYKRFCPCRGYRKEQIALCKHCF